MLAKEAIHFSFLSSYALSKVIKGNLYSFSVSRCLSLFITYYYSVQGFPYWGRGIGGNLPIVRFFFEPPAPHQNRCPPMGCLLHVKMKLAPPPPI